MLADLHLTSPLQQDSEKPRGSNAESKAIAVNRISPGIDLSGRARALENAGKWTMSPSMFCSRLRLRQVPLRHGN
jgi:hypothetical protein